MTKNKQPAEVQDDERWIESVIANLAHRSPESQQALARAILANMRVTSSGHVSGVELNTRKSAKNEHSTGDRSPDQPALHVSGTTIPKAHSQAK